MQLFFKNKNNKLKRLSPIILFSLGKYYNYTKAEENSAYTQMSFIQCVKI